MTSKTVLSCIQPSGELHVGNYFGAISNWVRLQDEGEHRCIYGIVDLHAMSMSYEPHALREPTEDMVLDLMACGLDPGKCILFVQSLVPEHAELYWILQCVCSYGDLTRQSQFKDKSRQVASETKDDFVSAGLFSYPVLQAADILIYKADYVPVGKDQEQHLELSRRIARRFNRQFADLFPEPAVLATETPKVQSLADPLQKMSKSLGPKHYIGLFEEPDSIAAKIKSAVTDSGDEIDEMSSGVRNLIALLRVAGRGPDADTFEAEYDNGSLKYSHLKAAVSSALIELTSPLRERRASLAAHRKRNIEVVYDRSADARKIAKETLTDVREAAGLVPRRSSA